MWEETFTGVSYYPTDPHVEDINIEDIAHHLALQCRFNGACKVFYSVAQHSVLVSKLCKNYPLWGLLHDAAEAYLGDLVRPVKYNSELGYLYKSIEKLNMWAIINKFNLEPVEPAEVKVADDILLATEARDLMRSGGANWNLTQLPLQEKIQAWTWQRAEMEFLERFLELKK